MSTGIILYKSQPKPGLWQRIRGRISELLSESSNAMTRTLRLGNWRWRNPWQRSRVSTNDWTRPDYDFWRRAYYCRVKGLEISGLFIRPLVNKIAAWTLGRAPIWRTGSLEIDTLLSDWWKLNHASLVRVYRAALRQGDCFVVVNPNLTLTILPPDIVEPIVDESNFARIIGWRVVQSLTHPTRPGVRQEIVDEYYADVRVHRVVIDSRVINEQTFPNLLGRLTIVHVSNQPDDGEVFGHAEAEAMVEILHRYGEIFEAAVEGNKLQGRPTPVLEFVTPNDLDKFWADYGEEETHVRADGSVESSTVLGVDLSELLAVSGAKFQYAHPGSFAADTQILLGLMFYLLLEHCEIPEFVFGNAITSSQASAETQMPVFETFITMRQGELTTWCKAVAEIVLGYMAITRPGKITAEMRDKVQVQWRKMTQEGRLTLDTLTWAYMEGLIDRRTALLLSPIEVDDLDGVLDRAEQEKREREDRQAELGEQQVAAQAKARADSSQLPKAKPAGTDNNASNRTRANQRPPVRTSNQPERRAA